MKPTKAITALAVLLFSAASFAYANTDENILEQKQSLSIDKKKLRPPPNQ